MTGTSFLNWNIPHGIVRSSVPVSSPMSISTPSDIIVTTPQAVGAPSPDNGPSSFTKLITMRETANRAHMFFEGRYDALVKSLRRDEKE